VHRWKVICFQLLTGDGFAILDEYFEQLATGSGLVNDIGNLEESPTSTAESFHQDEAFEPTGRSMTSGALTAPQYQLSTDTNAVSSVSSTSLANQIESIQKEKNNSI
jgi:hypothetical protein